MWRRGLIRLVLAANWCVAGLAYGMGWYPHFGEWFDTAENLVRSERNQPSIQAGSVSEREPMTEQERDEYFARRDHYRQLTERLYRSGSNGWLWVSGTCTATAVLLMIAFPKKPEVNT